MSDETQVPVPTADAVKPAMTPATFLASLPGSPSADMVENWKQQAPNNKIKIFSPDGKRAYILRGITGFELATIQKQLEGMATPSANPELEVQLASVTLACIWTNVGTNHKLDGTILRSGTAGLPQTLFQIVSELSDFYDPAKLDFMSGDL